MNADANYYKSKRYIREHFKLKEIVSKWKCITYICSYEDDDASLPNDEGEKNELKDRKMSFRHLNNTWAHSPSYDAVCSHV